MQGGCWVGLDIFGSLPVPWHADSFQQPQWHQSGHPVPPLGGGSTSAADQSQPTSYASQCIAATGAKMEMCALFRVYFCRNECTTPIGKKRTKQENRTLSGLHVFEILEGYRVCSLLLLEITNSFLLVVTSLVGGINARWLACSWDAHFEPS